MLASDVVAGVEETIKGLLMIGRQIADRKEDLRKSDLSEDGRACLEALVADHVEAAKSARRALIPLFPDQKAPARNFLFRNDAGVPYGVKITAARKPLIQAVEDVNVEITHYDNIE